jgi:hypothetical protein
MSFSSGQRRRVAALAHPAGEPLRGGHKGQGTRNPSTDITVSLGDAAVSWTAAGFVQRRSSPSDSFAACRFMEGLLGRNAWGSRGQPSL